MSVVRTLLLTAKAMVEANLPTGLKAKEIYILPEGKVPASTGQRSLTIHTSSLRGITPEASTRQRVVDFGLTISQRIRDIPNDRFGEIAYLEAVSMSSVLEHLVPVIESEEFTQAFAQSLSEIVVAVGDSSIVTDFRPKYSIVDAVKFLSVNTDPVHLYPSDFLTRNNDINDKEQIYDKIAGYRMTATFESPAYVENYSPIQCKGIDFNDEGGSSTP